MFSKKIILELGSTKLVFIYIAYKLKIIIKCKETKVKEQHFKITMFTGPSYTSHSHHSKKIFNFFSKLKFK